MANPSQLYLLADHIKLSLLERQRAISLNLDSSSQDGSISRSLESMREGIEAVEQEAARLKAKNDSLHKNLDDQAARLRSQYDDLTSQFRGFTTGAATAQANTPSLQADFDHASSRPAVRKDSSLKRSGPTAAASTAAAANLSKSVRFTDKPADAAVPFKDAVDGDEAAARAALFPTTYRDTPSPPTGSAAVQDLSNEQIHTYHSTVLAEQDEQLDRLGESIGRQRDLSIMIGDELDEHVQLLDDVEVHVDRHQGRLDGARRSLGRLARRANDNKQITTIVVLIVILVLLIIILK